MKSIKHILVISLFFVLFLAAGCEMNFGGGTTEVSFSLAKNDLVLEVGEIEELAYEVTEGQTVSFIIEDESVISYNNNQVEALKEGETDIKFYVNQKLVGTAHVKVGVEQLPVITIQNKLAADGAILLCANEQIQLKYHVDLDSVEVTFEARGAIEYRDGYLFGAEEGEGSIIIRAGKASKEVSVHVLPQSAKYDIYLFVEGEEAQDELTMEVEEVKAFNYLFALAVPGLESAEEAAVTVEGAAVVLEDGQLKAVAKGTAIVKVVVEEAVKTLTINVVVPQLPTISLAEGQALQLKASWNETIDVCQGLIALDGEGNDIASSLEIIEDYDKQSYGVSYAKIQASDSLGHNVVFERPVNVVWDYDVMFIGHAGCYYGLMNSEEAFLYAAQVLKYQAMECDLKQTKDGVFVMSHDDTFGEYTIAQTNWSVFENYEVTQGRKAGYPSQNGSVTGSPYTTKLCTLARYLEICKEYNMIAVIELKSSAGITNSDQSRMQALMNEIEAADMLNQVIFLGSQYNCLIWTRQHNYEYIPCQYLVNSLENETFLQRCIDYDLDISINVTSTYSNSDEWLAKYYEKGIKVSTYTFTQYVDYPEVQKWIDKGVHFVTCDWQLMSEFNLPKTGSTVQTYNVKFYVNEELVKETTVKQGRAAAAPSVSAAAGYEFSGWDKDITNVQEDLVVNAQFALTQYSITYMPNNVTLVESSWENKAAFVEEFYTDLFNWIEKHYERIPEIVKNGDAYTMTKNGKTATFSDKDSLLALDLYDFEKTISNIIYRPVTRNNDDSCVIIEDENYFLNSTDYINKYQDVDRWLMNAINVGYSSYRKTYEPLSDGRIQVFFRMHQWAKGTNIAAFNELPAKYIVVAGDEVTLPETGLSYNIQSAFTLPTATSTKAFGGWYLEKECINKIEKIEAGMTGNLVLYAKWLSE